MPLLGKPAQLHLELEILGASPEELNPYTLNIGDEVPVRALVVGASAGDTVRLEITVPRGLEPVAIGVPDSNVANELLEALITQLLGILNDLFPDFESLPDDIVEITGNDQQVTFIYEVDQSLIGEDDGYIFSLRVMGQVAGEFTIQGVASIVDPVGEESQALLPVPNVAEARHSLQGSASLLLQVNVPLPASGQCVSKSVSLNVRSAPAFDGGVTILLPQFDGYLYLDGVYELPVTSDNIEKWFHVAGYLDANGSVIPLTEGGWVYSSTNPAQGYQGQDPCNMGASNGTLDALAIMNNHGATLTPTPTVPPADTATPTISPTPTLTLTPTYTPTGPTPTPIPAPSNLCYDRAAEEQWLHALCFQGWMYLSQGQREELQQALNTNLVAADFISLDTWWLQNVGHGITDVPPDVWQADSLSQCGQNATCQGIVNNTVYLFQNLPRIGVDLNSGGGTGQTIDAQYETFQAGLLPTSSLPENAIWGHKVKSLACRDRRITFGAFSGLADVCWVCQDLATELYRATAPQLADFETVMRQHEEIKLYKNPVSRFVPAVYQYLRSQGQIKAGGETPYVIGDIAFLSDASRTDHFQYFHSGIVIRGYSGAFEDALDYVLIAQMSFSSQGYFTNDRSFARESAYSAKEHVGRFEIITLRTYLYKSLIGQGRPIPTTPADIQSEANKYMAHGRPSEIGY